MQKDLFLSKEKQTNKKSRKEKTDKKSLGSFQWSKVIFFNKISFENDVIKSSKVSRYFLRSYLFYTVLIRN